MEGAGVRLKRGFSNVEAALFDPFLLFDDFSSTIPEHYLAGFPWHPHRGMETVTYILDGAVRHKDSLGNEGVISGGDLQWMTAGSGIIHEEMPESVHGIRGFQLWVNLPKKNKMDAPRYQDLVGKAMPEVVLGRDAHARIIAGAEIFKERSDYINPSGVASSQAPNILYLDITLDVNGSVSLPIPEGHTVFAYVIEGALAVDDGKENFYAPNTILLFNREGDTINLRAPAAGARFLLIAGAPLHEPIAWRGPIVMNTDEELREAFAQLRAGTFIHP